MDKRLRKITMKPSVLFFSALICLSMACKNGKQVSKGAATPISWEKIETGNYSGMETESYQLIQDAKSWSVLWEQLTSNRYPAPAVPKVDFTSRSVIACMMGMRPNGGFSISIKSLAKQEGTLLLEVVHMGPGAGCFMTDALTQPYYLASVPRTSGDLNVSKDVVLEDCE